MELYLKLIDVIVPVFFVIGVGYYLGKKDPKFDTKFITNFAGNIGTPAMIFYTITTTGITLDIFIESKIISFFTNNLLFKYFFRLILFNGKLYSIK